MSIIELMIGITIGLFILAGATLVVTGQLSEGRRLLTDTQIQQDLRAASDIIARDVRRAGYTGNGTARRCTNSRYASATHDNIER